MDVQRNAPLLLVILGVRYGVIGATVNVLSALVLAGLELHYKAGGVNFFLPLLTVLIIPAVAIYNFKKHRRRLISLKEALRLGLTIVFIMSIVEVSFQLIFTHLLEPDFYEKYYELNREAFFETHSERYPGMTWEQFDIDMQEGKDMFWKPQLTLIFITRILLGLISSLIAGLMLRARRADHERLVKMANNH